MSMSSLRDRTADPARSATIGLCNERGRCCWGLLNKRRPSSGSAAQATGGGRLGGAQVPAQPAHRSRAGGRARVAEGLTNREVAARLRLSVRTAENHLLNVMNKLGFNNRAQVAGWFARTQSTNESLRS